MGETELGTVAELTVTDDIREARPENPALARLFDHLTGEEPETITSYDRMHHRHNRS